MSYSLAILRENVYATFFVKIYLVYEQRRNKKRRISEKTDRDQFGY